MAGNQTTFFDRLARIEAERTCNRRGGRRQEPYRERIIVHADGFAQRAFPRPRRLRFGFPIKGVLLASLAAILVKGYLIWALGDDVYGLAVAELLAGNDLERAAGLVMAPDALSNAVVDVYQTIYRFLVSLATALETGTFPTFA